MILITKFSKNLKVIVVIWVLKNCKDYIDSVKSEKIGESSTSNKYMIEINSFINQDY